MKKSLFAAILAAAMCSCSSQDVIELGFLKQKTLSETHNDLAIGCETIDRDYTDYHAYKEYLEPLGMRYLRLQAGWAKTEKVKGVYDWAWLDSIIDDAVSRGLEPWVEFSYGNPIYEGGGTVYLGAKWPVSEEGVTAWCNWARAMVTRYKGKVHQWEFWNEPDGNPKNEELVTLAIKTAEILKEIDPDSKIAAFGTTFYWRNAKAQVKLLHDRLGDREGLFDWLSYHGYYFRPEDSYLKCGAPYIEFLKKIGFDIDVWQGEMGAPSTGFKGGGLSKYPWSEVTQAKFGIRKMLFDHSYGVRTSLFCIADMNYSRNDNIKIKNVKGLLETNDTNGVVRPKMAYGTVRNMVSIWDNLDEICDSTAVSIDAGTRCVAKSLYTDAETGLSSAVIWDYTKAPVDACTYERKEVEISGFKGRNPVCIDLLSGRVTKIPFIRKGGKAVFRKFPFYDSPVVLCDRSLIELQ